MSDGMTEMAYEREQERWGKLTKKQQSEMLQREYDRLDALRKQEGGNHYKDMAIQPVEFITANNLGFLEGNVVKYICRHHAKNGAEDIKKAIHYCELLLQTKYGETK